MSLTRRQVVTAAAAGLVGSTVSFETSTARAAQPDSQPRWKISLNTSTIRGQKLPLDKQFDVAATAGYDGVEPWLGDIEAFVKAGGSLEDLAKKNQDRGLEVVDAIGFAQWIVDDDVKRKAGLEQAKRDMELVRRLGGSRIAAPPAGETNNAKLDLFAAAERYRALCEIGHSLGVTPLLELWGFSKCLSRLGEVAFVAVESGHQDACVLADIYHIHKGGSRFEGLDLFSGRALPIFHINDYPANPGRAEIKDADRVYPGDGVAPFCEIANLLLANGFDGYLSLELFNPEYWKQDALEVAKTGLRKTKDSLAKCVVPAAG